MRTIDTRRPFPGPSVPRHPGARRTDEATGDLCPLRHKPAAPGGLPGDPLQDDSGTVRRRIA